jgi:hypothetical protein
MASTGGPTKVITADLREVRVLGQEAVAGVNRIDVRDLGGTDNSWNVEVALVAVRRPDADGFVGKTHIGGVPVGLGVDRHGLYAELTTRPDDPEGYFPSIGNQNS